MEWWRWFKRGGVTIIDPAFSGSEVWFPFLSEPITRVFCLFFLLFMLSVSEIDGTEALHLHFLCIYLSIELLIHGR